MFWNLTQGTTYQKLAGEMFLEIPLNLKKPRKFGFLENPNIFFLENYETFSKSVFCIKFIFANKKLLYFLFLKFLIFFGQKFGQKFWFHNFENWRTIFVFFWQAPRSIIWLTLYEISAKNPVQFFRY